MKYELEGYRDPASWFRFAEAYDLLVARMPADRPSIVVEVGCWKGASTRYLGERVIESRKPITIVAIDHFKGSASEPSMVERAASEDVFAVFQQNVAPVRAVLGDERFRLHCIDSLAAAAAWEYECPEAVWLDGDHSYAAVKADIAAWWPLVRGGGVLGGDDYDQAGVRRAVHEFHRPHWVASRSVSWWWMEKR